MKTIANEAHFFSHLAQDTHDAISNLIAPIFGGAAQKPILGPITTLDLGVVGFVLLAVLVADAQVAWFFHVKHKKVDARPDRLAALPPSPVPADAPAPPAKPEEDWRHHFLGALAQPIHLFLWVLALYAALVPLILKFFPANAEETARQYIDRVFDLALFAVLFWFFFQLTRVVEAIPTAWASRTPSKLDDLLAPLVGRTLRVIVPVIGIIFALPILGLPSEYATVVAKGSSILIIIAVAWILSQCVSLGERVVLTKFDIKAADNLQARKIYTQVHVISKTIYVLIAIFTVASVLMLFEEARRFGTSILASAGVLGVILGFAAQQTISNLFAGVQVALTQPIRLDDVVVLEGEWGRVEEISLTYVIIHIWDDRRLVVPLSYFIQKPFQNWTRSSSSITGSVLLSVDYTLPVEETRAAVKQIVESSTLWDKRFWNLQVSDASEQTIQLRVLATSADSSKSWDLRCEIREKLVTYIQSRHPNSLPQKRVQLASDPTKPIQP